MTLDAKRTFDHMIEEYAPSPDARDRILTNRIYQQLSSAVAGSQEYMAMEKLYELHEAGEYDLLVLDTPPSRNALDFIDAPDRVTRFIDSKTLRVFMEGGMKAGGRGLRALGRGSLVAFKAVERVIGVSFFSDITEFLLAFDGMYDGFKERAVDVRALLGDPRTVFLLVTAPERRPIDEAVFFWRKLVEAELPFGGVIVNKVHPTILGDDRHRSETALHRAATGQLADAGLPAELAGRVADAFIAYQALADRDRENVRMLTRRLGPQPLLEIPFLDEDVHDVAGLERLDEFLFTDARARSRNRNPSATHEPHREQGQHLETGVRREQRRHPGGIERGLTSTQSKPRKSSPASDRRNVNASRLVGPPTSGVPVPGANAGSTKSTSNERKHGPIPTRSRTRIENSAGPSAASSS